MSVGLFLSLAFLAWGPPATLSVFTVFPYPFMFIVFVAAIVFGVGAFLISSLFWLLISNAGDRAAFLLTW